MKQWNIKRNRENYANAQLIQYSLYDERVLKNNSTLKDGKLNNPFLFLGMKDAVDKINYYIENNKKITIYGDFDMDGITSTATGVSLLTQYAVLKNSKSIINFYIPDREKEGYGLNKTAIKTLKDKNVDLIITVDCGISSVNEVEYAKELGMDIIVTDHHEMPEVLPDCITINPKDNSYPFKYLSGCAVIFKVFQALYYNKFSQNYVYSFIDIVSMSIISDVMPLIDENRLIVQYGLKLLNNNISRGKRQWVDLLLKNSNPANTKQIEINSGTVAFVIAPRINSIGRLSHASLGVFYLLSGNKEKLIKLSEWIEALNKRRIYLQDKAVKESQKYLESHGVENNIALCVDCPSGIAGLVAANILEKYYRPTVIFTKSNGFYKGSARSIDGFNYFENVIKPNQDIIVKGGGHAGAAGFTIKEGDFDIFNSRINKSMETTIQENPELLYPVLDIECELYMEDINYDFYKSIQTLEPFGEGNKQPLFLLRSVNIKNITPVPKDNPKHLQIVIEKNNITIKSILFKQANLYKEFSELENVDLVFSLSLNSWRNRNEVQLVIKDYKESICKNKFGEMCS